MTVKKKAATKPQASKSAKKAPVVRRPTFPQSPAAARAEQRRFVLALAAQRKKEAAARAKVPAPPVPKVERAFTVVVTYVGPCCPKAHLYMKTLRCASFQVARRKVVAEVKMRKGVPTEAVVFDCAAGQYWSPVEVR